MKFIREIPKADEAVTVKLEEEGWKPLKEPEGIQKATLYSLPFMLINSLIFTIMIYNIYPPFKAFLNQDEFSINFNMNFVTVIVFIGTMYGFLSVHEFIHALFIPKILTSDKIFWGLTGSFGFVYTTEKMKRNRFLLVSIMPLLILSFILPLTLASLGLLNGFIIFLCLVNAGGSSVDILNMAIVGSQVPKDSYIVNNGFKTYFK
ncbi:MAG: DUF3267 domain-containing protein [Clostridium sp.]|nr:DUF3267 domain-containing protein [Clostridium sp.]